jgi:type I restriction enzyme S subunit
MKKYNNYKDSDVEWIGKIPSHWIMQRIDWVSKIVRGNTAFKKDELLDAGEYIALQYGKTYKVDVVDDSFNFYVNSEFFNESQVTTKGDTILISTSETVEDLGHTCFYNNQNVGLLGGEQILLKPNRKFLHEKYLYHYSRQFGSELRRYARGLKVFRFNTSDLKQLFIAIPTLEEQISIANYLDHKTSQIDHLIAKKEQFIKLLEEERVAVINQAVTKGLNPNVTMKDSGVEWLGKIPEHWERARIKTLVAIKVCDGPHETPEWKEEGIPFISAEAIKGNQIDLNYKRGFISEEQHLEYCKKSKVQKGDILFCKSGSTTGKSALVENDDEFGIWSP